MPSATQQIRGIKFEDFDPNDLERGFPTWAVFKGSSFKTYLDRGHAINAFLQGYQAKLYERVNGRWEERAVKHGLKRPDDRCEVCGGDATWGRYVFDRERGRLLEPLKLLFTCSDCASDVRRA